MDFLQTIKINYSLLTTRYVKIYRKNNPPSLALFSVHPFLELLQPLECLYRSKYNHTFWYWYNLTINNINSNMQEIFKLTRKSKLKTQKQTASKHLMKIKKQY